MVRIEIQTWLAEKRSEKSIFRCTMSFPQRSHTNLITSISSNQSWLFTYNNKQAWNQTKTLIKYDVENKKINVKCLKIKKIIDE